MSSTLSKARMISRRVSSSSISRSVQKSSYSTNVVAQHNEKWRPLVERDVLQPIQFPRERPGIENANTKHLLQRAYGKLSQQKALSVDNIPAKDYQKLVSFLEDGANANQWNSFSPKFHRRVQREIAYYLTHTPSIFVFDGDFGHNAVKLRVITDNGTTGLLLKNLVLPTRPVSAQSFEYNALVFHAPGFEFTPSNIVEEYGGPTPSDLGLSSDKFVLSNEKENRITIAGLSDSELLLDSIVYVTSKAAIAQGALVIPSDSLVSKNGTVTLVVNTTADDEANIRRSVLNNSQSNVSLYGAQHNLLSKNGLSRVWGGVRVAVKSEEAAQLKLKQGDVVERVDGGKRLIITSKQSAQANLVKKPSNIVFLVKDTTSALPEVGKIDANTASALVQSGKSAFPATSSTQQLFSELTSGAQFFVVNSSSQNVAKAVERITNGDVQSISSVDQKVQQSIAKKL